MRERKIKSDEGGGGELCPGMTPPIQSETERRMSNERRWRCGVRRVFVTGGKDGANDKQILINIYEDCGNGRERRTE